MSEEQQGTAGEFNARWKIVTMIALVLAFGAAGQARLDNRRMAGEVNRLKQRVQRLEKHHPKAKKPAKATNPKDKLKK